MGQPTPQTTKAHTEYFRLNGQAQDRLKFPRSFWANLKIIGLTPGVVLRHCQLPPTVYHGEASLTTRQSFAVWRAIGELSKDPGIGWKFIRQGDTHQYHPTLLAALHARTYRDSLTRLARYKQLCGAQEFRFTHKGDEVRVEVSWPFAGEEAPPDVLMDGVFAVVMELGRRGTRTMLKPKRIELRRRAEPDNGLEAYFGCAIKYGASRDALVLRTVDLERPFVTHNEELLQMLSPQFENQLLAQRTNQTVLEQVKWVLKRLLAGSRPDLVMVAKELGMSERTLQRRITDAGSTFREVVNETRQELVRHYLADASVEISAAAFLVGYEDPKSFYRAFRAWEGKTPAQWRAANRKSKRG